jgi:hypothetical protein
MDVSENAAGAENQQERLFTSGWIVRTAKRDNFVKFARIIRLMRLRRHLSLEGIVEIAEIAQTMNFRKPSEVLRILRDHTPTSFSISREEDEMVRTLWRRREAGGNDQPAGRGSPPDRSTSNRFQRNSLSGKSIARYGSDPVQQPAHNGETLIGCSDSRTELEPTGNAVGSPLPSREGMTP